MAQELLVDERIEDGRKLIAELARDQFDVTIAFWVKTSEEGLWSLYIGSRSVEAGKSADAYRALYACLSRMPDSGITMAEVKLVSASNPIASDAIAVRDRHHGRAPARYRGSRLGHVPIEEAYIYPPLPAPPPAHGVEMRKLKTDVPQIERPEDFELSPGEKAAVRQLMAQGVNVQQAEEWVRKKRDKQHPRPPIPSGTTVKTWVAAAWGDKPEEDPNPLLLVEGPGGARGLTFKGDTDPV